MGSESRGERVGRGSLEDGKGEGETWSGENARRKTCPLGPRARHRVQGRAPQPSFSQDPERIPYFSNHERLRIDEGVRDMAWSQRSRGEGLRFGY